MLKRKNIVNISWISQCGIENVVQCILPDIPVFVNVWKNKGDLQYGRK